MNWIRLAVVVCPLLAASLPVCAHPAPQNVGMPGGYQATDVDSALVREAKAAVQKNLATLRIEAVRDAYVQVVAGLNFKLICEVKGEDGPTVWEFVIWHRLDDTWQLTGARQL